MYKLTTINIEKIDCPILIRNTPDGTQEHQEHKERRFTNGAELVASSFEEKYDIKTVRICKDRDASSGCDSYIEIIVSKPECEQPISRNKDDSFF